MLSLFPIAIRIDRFWNAKEVQQVLKFLKSQKAIVPLLHGKEIRRIGPWKLGRFCGTKIDETKEVDPDKIRPFSCMDRIDSMRYQSGLLLSHFRRYP